MSSKDESKSVVPANLELDIVHAEFLYVRVRTCPCGCAPAARQSLQPLRRGAVTS
jgi:hypothetical protein